jgi:hypothetical protein
MHACTCTRLLLRRSTRKTPTSHLHALQVLRLVLLQLALPFLKVLHDWAMRNGSIRSAALRDG